MNVVFTNNNKQMLLTLPFRFQNKTKQNKTKIQDGDKLNAKLKLSQLQPINQHMVINSMLKTDLSNTKAVLSITEKKKSSVFE